MFTKRTDCVRENEHAIAIRDAFPVSNGHTLIVPKRRVASIFDLSEEEVLACWRLLAAEREVLRVELGAAGFNVGVNDGTAAGQTIGHAHIHLIPRYLNDHPNPKGGVRAVIPGKAVY